MIMLENYPSDRRLSHFVIPTDPAAILASGMPRRSGPRASSIRATGLDVDTIGGTVGSGYQYPPSARHFGAYHPNDRARRIAWRRPSRQLAVLRKPRPGVYTGSRVAGFASIRNASRRSRDTRLGNRCIRPHCRHSRPGSRLSGAIAAIAGRVTAVSGPVAAIAGRVAAYPAPLPP